MVVAVWHSHIQMCLVHHVCVHVSERNAGWLTVPSEMTAALLRLKVVYQDNTTVMVPQYATAALVQLLSLWIVVSARVHSWRHITA
jgi:hypothetical protein